MFRVIFFIYNARLSLRQHTSLIDFRYKQDSNPHILKE